MKVQTFNDVQREVRNAIVSRPIQEQVQQEPEKEAKKAPFPEVGERWPGPVYGAPYDNPRLAAHNFYKMPGRRREVQDIINEMWGVKKTYLKRFITSGLFGVSAVVTLWIIPLPFSIVAVPLVGLAMFYWHNAWNGKSSDWEAFKKFGVMRNVLTDHVTNPEIKAPFRFKRMYIWK